jgi:hypothetical protein
MLRVLGGPKRLCDGLTRRDLLLVGSLGLAGGVRPTWANPYAQAVPAQRPTGNQLGRFGQAKSCILLFLYGSPSQMETFDPKPDAPVEIRGEFGWIPSIVPGLDVCEYLPHLAHVMDKVTVIRSVSHRYPLHGVAFATSGLPNLDGGPDIELSPRAPGLWPFIGSVVDYLEEAQLDAAGGRTAPEVPRNLLLPFPFSSQRIDEPPRSGPYGGFLGPKWDPVCTEFVGQATRKSTKWLAAQGTWEDFDPYLGITPESRFQLGAVLNEGSELTIDRLDRRRTLLQQIEQLQRDVDRYEAAQGIERNRAMAYRLLGSAKLRQAFDLGQETPETRDLYGMTLFGQGALTARRLVEAGGRFLSVFWDEYGQSASGWDTHNHHFSRMKDELLPNLDRTLSGLLIDLDQRGLLDETLVVLLSEHGRTPKLRKANGGGRDHWSRCYSVVLAGGGIARGQVIGRSDKIGGDPVERRVSPKDILATIYHLMGIPVDTMLTDREGRPMPLIPGGEVLAEALA